MQNPDEHKIDELRDGLYSRGFEPKPIPPRSSFNDQLPKVESSWKHEAEEPIRPMPNPEQSRSFFKKLTIAAGIFFLLSAVAAASIFFFGWNIVSTDKVDITFYGPVSVAAGESLVFDVAVQNKNNTDILDPVLYLEFPAGTKEAGDLTKDLIHGKETLDPIASGDSQRKTVSAVLFGQEHEIKEVRVKLEYRISGSDTAVFKKEKVYDVSISSTPVSFVVTGTREVVSGEEASFTVDVTSNSSVPLKNLMVKADYPFGFTYKSATPAPTFDSNIWSIPTLSPGEKKTYIIKGIIEGEQGDERTIRFTTGIQSTVNDKEIATAFLARQSSVLLRKPPIAVAMRIAGQTGSEAVAEAGKGMGGEVAITNNLPVQIANATVAVTFGGPAFDPLSPESAAGFYRSSDKTIVWDRTAVPSLALLNPGQTVTVDFRFSSPQGAASLRNGTISVSAVAAGKQLGDGGGEIFTVSQSRVVKLQSNLTLAPRVVYSVGPFKNTGPIPPKAEKETTYTIVWTAANTTNAVSRAEVTAQLPQYVQWKNATSPAAEKITWNPDTREVTWTIGDMEPRTSRQGMFQISFMPSTSQVGSAPILVDRVVIRGVDAFTDMPISADVAPHTTSLSTDPQFGSKDGMVVR